MKDRFPKITKHKTKRTLIKKGGNGKKIRKISDWKYAVLATMDKLCVRAVHAVRAVRIGRYV